MSDGWCASTGSDLTQQQGCEHMIVTLAEGMEMQSENVEVTKPTQVSTGCRLDDMH